MINEVIILAGGLGTRLQGVVSNIPKPMAPIAGKPFLDYIFYYLRQFPIKKVILAVGYKYEVIEVAFGNHYLGMDIEYAIEKEPLGTGGAIINAFRQTCCDDLFLINGDTFFNVDLEALSNQHQTTNAQLTLSLKELQDFDRYGTVTLNGSRVTSFNEKQPMKNGLINGGVYALNRSLFENPELPAKFSFEKDVMEKQVSLINMQAYISDGYFIDIGIPEDYARGQQELPNIFEIIKI
jgi:D-glycero-alpha-D-manno-heptose 1-phosphate guanylyltransferase